MFTTLLIQPLANGLILFYKILGGNLGLAIIAFSLILRVVLHPLTKPYLESMKKMKDLSPQLDKLKKRHKGDKVKLAQAQADFYKEKGINPGAGCLPYILQIVILIAFFHVFIRTLSGGADPTTEFNSLLYEPLKLAEGQALNTKFLYLELSNPDTIEVASLPFSLPGPLLFLAAIIQLISAKITAPYSETEEEIAEKTEEKEDDIQVVMQKSMVYTFPLFTLIIGVRFASALALYWLTFSITQAYQQYRIQGWGGLTPWLKRFNLLKSDTKKKATDPGVSGQRGKKS